MIIETVTLENFGPHARLECNFNGNIVGIIGPNGSGKSTLLKALQYAFTGEFADESAETFVRSVAPVDEKDKPAKNGSVDVTFRIHGKRGRIFRKFGASPSRRLEWDDKVGAHALTKTSDIDPVLREIFSADKQAIANAIFLSQGALDKLLFGEQPEREKLFMRLLLIGHFSTVENAIDTQLASLNARAQDNSAVIDEVRTQLDSARTQLSFLNGAALSMPDRTADIQIVNSGKQFIEDRAAAVEAKVTADAQLGTAQSGDNTEVDLARVIYEIRGTNLGAGEQAYPVAQRLLLDQENIATAQREEVADLNACISTRKRLETLKGALEFNAQATKQLAEQEASLSARISGLLPNAQELVTLVEARNKYEADLEAAAQSLRTAESDLLQQLQLRPQIEKNKAEILAATESLIPLSADAAMLRTRINLAGVLGSPQPGQVIDHCPLCNQAVGESTFKSGWSNEDHNSLRELEKRMGIIAERIDSLKSWNTQTEQKIATAQTTCENAKAQVFALQGNPVTAPSEAGNYTLDALRGMVAERASCQRELSQLTPRKSALDKELERLKGSASEGEMQWFETSLPVEKYSALMRDAEYRATKTSAGVGRLRTAITAFTDARTKIANLHAAVDSANSRLQKIEATRPALEAALRKLDVQLNEIQLNQTLATLTQANAQRSEALGQVRQQENTITQLQTRFNALKAQEEAQACIRETAEQMKQLKRTFKRDGLASTYMQYRFAQLAELTQNFLMLMNASFVVFPDISQPLSFQFSRNDDPAILPLPQNKLSGGQRVRLTVAFLLAVQQLIIPKIGFLSIDEPSTHLDPEGVASLRELFETLRQSLQNAEAQIVVCDHHVDLTSAFEKTTLLAGPTAYRPPVSEIAAPVKAPRKSRKPAESAPVEST